MFANASFERILDYAPDEVPGRPICNLVHPDHRAAALLQAERVMGARCSATSAIAMSKGGVLFPCTFELEPVGDAVKLTITHAMEHGGAKFLQAVAGGWPRILANLKSLLETGDVVLKG